MVPLNVTVSADTFIARWKLGSAIIRLEPTEPEFREFLEVLRIIAPGVHITGHPAPTPSE